MDDPRGQTGPVARRAWLYFRLVFSRFFSVGAARADLLDLAGAASAARTDPEAPRQLLVDVSVISRSDRGTGIQRVVRELLHELIRNPPPGFEIRPVFATFWHGYRYAAAFMSSLTGQSPAAGPDGPVQPRSGDIFLGLDLAAHILPHHPLQLARWKMAGVRLHFIVYDLLPALHPEWFSRKLGRRYRNWMRTVALFADGAACISRSVSEELKTWLSGAYGKSVPQSIAIGWFYLGSNPAAAAPGRETPAERERFLKRIEERPTLLMVGTIEPRKGYDQVLSAFERLWQQGCDVNLVIIGKTGWKVGRLIRRMRAHPEAGRRLIWLENAPDATLSILYEKADGFLMASEGEGFGLPIVEAARYGTPVLARDLPVFREIAGTGALYFSGLAHEPLAEKILEWIGLIGKNQAPASGNLPLSTWSESARHLMDCITTKQEPLRAPRNANRRDR